MRLIKKILTALSQMRTRNRVLAVLGILSGITIVGYCLFLVGFTVLFTWWYASIDVPDVTVTIELHNATGAPVFVSWVTDVHRKGRLEVPAHGEGQIEVEEVWHRVEIGHSTAYMDVTVTTEGGDVLTRKRVDLPDASASGPPYTRILILDPKGPLPEERIRNELDRIYRDYLMRKERDIPIFCQRGLLPASQDYVDFFFFDPTKPMEIKTLLEKYPDDAWIMCLEKDLPFVQKEAEPIKLESSEFQHHVLMINEPFSVFIAYYSAPKPEKKPAEGSAPADAESADSR